ncbi:hypothetical protein BpHYR1_009052 [Brachionus plicatilis]|uniref:Uncharacterized protein n=1 Tax=Brachionus plicatilis TaxID=10195 RepID=A0A3M7SVG3_BRAPC|nr:hypothetical protein BpHYR1_009052 [Brachionus plicatilis]
MCHFVDLFLFIYLFICAELMLLQNYNI